MKFKIAKGGAIIMQLPLFADEDDEHPTPEDTPNIDPADRASQLRAPIHQLPHGLSPRRQHRRAQDKRRRRQVAQTKRIEHRLFQ